MTAVCPEPQLEYRRTRTKERRPLTSRAVTTALCGLPPSSWVVS
jgi:hypothetical protein